MCVCVCVCVCVCACVCVQIMYIYTLRFLFRSSGHPSWPARRVVRCTLGRLRSCGCSRQGLPTRPYARYHIDIDIERSMCIYHAAAARDEARRRAVKPEVITMILLY